jgi:hypothetical protein
MQTHDEPMPYRRGAAVRNIHSHMQGIVVWPGYDVVEVEWADGRISTVDVRLVEACKPTKEAPNGRT